jgi:hypothetical protein
LRALAVSVHIHRPAAQGNIQPELVLLVTLSSERNDSQTLRNGEIERRAVTVERGGA